MHYLDETGWPAIRYTTTEAADAETSNPLVAGLRRVLELAKEALAAGRSDTQLLSAISAIQGATLQAEHEFYGPETDLDEQDVPF